MSRFDAVVVGAGPAGSTAARELAAAGARVLILEKEAFPRYKACGGGIPLRTEKLLPFPIDGWRSRTWARCGSSAIPANRSHTW